MVIEHDDPGGVICTMRNPSEGWLFSTVHIRDGNEHELKLEIHNVPPIR